MSRIFWKLEKSALRTSSTKPPNCSSPAFQTGLVSLPPLFIWARTSLPSRALEKLEIRSKLVTCCYLKDISDKHAQGLETGARRLYRKERIPPGERFVS